MTAHAFSQKGPYLDEVRGSSGGCQLEYVCENRTAEWGSNLTLELVVTYAVA